MDAAVIEILQQASSQDPTVFKPAEQTLKQWETQRGFYIALFNIFSNHSLAINVRWMAILCFKNGVDRYWRKNAPDAIAEDEKEFLRQHLITNFEEPVNQLAIQLAAVIAKITRYDYPREWASLVPTLLDVIRGQNPLAQHRALLTLHHVVKTLTSKRLSVDALLFRDFAASMFNFMLNLWNTFTESFFMMVSNGADTNQMQEALEKALISLRILRKLIVYGHPPSQSQDAMLFLKIIFPRARVCLEYRKTLISRGMQTELCEKFITHATKVLLEVLDIHPFCYVELIPTTLEFSVFYCFTEAGQALAFERFIIHCLNLIKHILFGMHYHSGACTDEKHTLLPLQEIQLKQNFFTPETLTEICSRFVTHYFLLTPAELELWDSYPESFAIDESGESWKYSLRPCTEAVFITFFRHFRSVFASVLVDLMQRHHQIIDPNDLHAILLKDAVYHAVGLAAFELYDEVNFDQWFSTTLKEELKIRSDNYRIIRRRVCWLIGQWTSVKLSAELRPELYKLMVEALSPEEHLGVRLAASRALKHAIDDFQFNSEEFSPYLESAFSLLFSLLKEVEEFETKMHVLYVLSFMIEQTGSSIKLYVGLLISYLPALWEQSEGHNMLRCAVVSALLNLHKALGSESVILQPFVVSVVALSCDINQEYHVYLLDGGLELWLALLENAPAPTPAIMDLFTNMPPILERFESTFRLCTYIIQAYVLLSPQEFCSQKGPVIIETFQTLLGDLQPDGTVAAIRFFETCVRASPQQGVELIKPVLTMIFRKIFNGINYMMVMTMSLSIAARVLLYSKDMFSQVISELTRTIGTDITEEAVLEGILQTWVRRMPLTTQPENRKLLALALCLLLDASNPTVLEYFSEIVTNIVETLNDITNVEDIGYAFDSLMISDQSSPSQDEDTGYETEHEQRMKRLSYNDPVHSISLKYTIQNQLRTLRQTVGDDKYNHLMQTLSPEIDEQLKDYISL